MNFLVDAQLPRRLARWLVARGHNAPHTLDLPLQNATPDLDVLSISNREQRIVITKDNDFPLHFQLGHGPPGLLFVTTGNISNDELLEIFVRNEAQLFQILRIGVFVELTRTTLIIHE